MSGRRVAGGLSVLGLLLWLPSGLVFVDETELVLVERLGRIVAVYDRPQDRGLQFKLPWPIDATRRFDRRVQVLSPPGREVFTRDRKNIIVDVFLCWRIAESSDAAVTPLSDRPVVRFFRGLGQTSTAEARLSSRLMSIVAAQVGTQLLSDLLTADDAEQGPLSGDSPLERLGQQLRHDVQQRPDEAQSWTAALGLELVDVRIRRLNLPTGNQQAVFERMRSERQKMAARYRSAGLADSTRVRSQAERQAGEILALAKADAAAIRAAGEAEAVQTLNAAYRQDPEFAQRLQMLEAYRQILNDRSTLVLSAGSPLWRLLTDGVALPTSLGGPAADRPASALRPANASVPVTGPP